ncbi:hypothetical protein ROHU_005596 [Labeo rohita]|uniref:Uncharacterized protein n=1 Tax=Labeo rohita TaxID=84645 RepID=A0A498MXS5_LABRO|nr:hypothetical protein ROHU_005596 [Labeo rohita]
MAHPADGLLVPVPSPSLGGVLLSWEGGLLTLGEGPPVPLEEPGEKSLAQGHTGGGGCRDQTSNLLFTSSLVYLTIPQK